MLSSQYSAFGISYPKLPTFGRNSLKKVKFVRAHRNILAALLIVLFFVNVKQACQLNSTNITEHRVDLSFKFSPFISGGTALCSTDRSLHNVLLSPIKVLFNPASSSFFSTFCAVCLLYISDYAARINTGTSVLRLICKLTI